MVKLRRSFKGLPRNIRNKIKGRLSETVVTLLTPEGLRYRYPMPDHMWCHNIHPPGNRVVCVKPIKRYVLKKQTNKYILWP